jgi:hypothetical protein
MLDSSAKVSVLLYRDVYEGALRRLHRPEGPRSGVPLPARPDRPADGQFKVVVFDEAFLSQRDRPYVDQILEKIGTTPGKAPALPAR